MLNQNPFEIPTINKVGISTSLENPFSVPEETELQKYLNEKIWGFFNRSNRDKYYSERAISYSFLKHLERIAKGYAPIGDIKVFQLGRAFEDMFCDTFDVSHYPDLTIEDLTNCRTWCENASQSEAIKKAYSLRSDREIQKETKKLYRGLRFKCKTDCETPYNVFDLKTTSATTQKEFYTVCKNLGYFGQGFLYTELTDKPFTLFGVSKTTENIFEVQMDLAEYEIGASQFEGLFQYVEFFGIAKEFE
jgi:hypothetical protein